MTTIMTIVMGIVTVTAIVNLIATITITVTAMATATTTTTITIMTMTTTTTTTILTRNAKQTSSG
jgi:hypothetical protein